MHTCWLYDSSIVHSIFLLSQINLQLQPHEIAIVEGKHVLMCYVTYI